MEAVKIRYYENPETGEPHIYDHGVCEEEVEEILENPGEDFPARRNSRSIIGQTLDGRYLRVIVVREAAAGSIFVVTAYDLSASQLAAYKRRRRKRKR
jgi:hypothetical protein